MARRDDFVFYLALPIAVCIICFAAELQALTNTKSYTSINRRSSHSIQQTIQHRRFLLGIRSKITASATLAGGDNKSEETIRVGDLLSDLPTPTLLIELSLAESALKNTTTSLDDALSLLSSKSVATGRPDRVSGNNNAIDETVCEQLLDGSIFLHTRVTDTSVRDRINREHGSGKSPVIGGVDACPDRHVKGGAYLGIGLSNHHVGGYYWARGMGIGASLEAHGVAFRETPTPETETGERKNTGSKSSEKLASDVGGGDAGRSGGELYWTRRSSDPTKSNSTSGSDAASGALCRGDTTEESSNSNDGKRSEWADFLVPGDTVQLIPYSPVRVLRESAFQRLVGVRRVGRPLGADPIVERLWERETATAEESSSNTTGFGSLVPL
ncbi:unnamed protein product [Pseudo-nitzschia multistriata]|uniref:Uncharacterized protein n=1 Tax=Pseudo-nitzschia multistriata TaxID=183589 RepID=A0A448ZLX8_9STRA|nr:unnamed protein product [Pseudo-nitzschia multistriata]